MITSLGEEGAGLCASRAFVCLFCTIFLSFFSSSWCRGLAAVCDCGTPLTFLLTLFLSEIICMLMDFGYAVFRKTYDAMHSFWKRKNK